MSSTAWRFQAVMSRHFALEFFDNFSAAVDCHNGCDDDDSVGRFPRLCSDVGLLSLPLFSKPFACHSSGVLACFPSFQDQHFPTTSASCFPCPCCSVAFCCGVICSDLWRRASRAPPVDWFHCLWLHYSEPSRALDCSPARIDRPSMVFDWHRDVWK